MKIQVYIQPNAKKSGYVGLYNGIPKLKITAPPVDGAANNEIIKIFSKILNEPKSNISILKGQTSKLKILDINTNKSYEEIIKQIQSFSMK